MFWLFLLGAVTVLIIALRRVLRRQKPLNDALHATKIAIDHVHDGVAFVQADGKIGSLNSTFEDLLGAKTSELQNQDWYSMFTSAERDRVQHAYKQMLLQGIASVETILRRANGASEPAHVRLVTVTDHKMRLTGHHCLVRNVARERALEAKVDQLTAVIEELRTVGATD